MHHDPDGKFKLSPNTFNLQPKTTASLKRRADLKLSRLLVRAASDDQRIIEAGYYPAVTGTITGTYIPVSGIYREGSTSATNDISSEIVEGAVYTWRVIDNGKVTGAVLKQRSTREINELTCRKLEASVGSDLLRIRNNLQAIEVREKSLAPASVPATTRELLVQQNLVGGLASQFEYRVQQNGLLQT